MQKFYANEKFKHENGAIAWRNNTPFDCLGAYAKINNCPIIVDGNEIARLTCYATGHADSFFSVPACTRKNGKYVKGYFTGSDTGTVFQVMDSSKHLFT
jgi:hypothetical protein